MNAKPDRLKPYTHQIIVTLKMAETKGGCEMDYNIQHSRPLKTDDSRKPVQILNGMADVIAKEVKARLTCSDKRTRPELIAEIARLEALLDNDGEPSTFDFNPEDLTEGVDLEAGGINVDYEGKPHFVDPKKIAARLANTQSNVEAVAEIIKDA